jgi:hypothetical protein
MEEAAMRLSRLMFLGFLCAVGYVGFLWVPPGPKTPGAFDPDKLAQLHYEVYQAYDGGAEWGLFVGYTKLLREQNKYSWFRAIDAGFHMARATSSLRTVKSHYAAQLLPDLEYVYTIERDWLGATFDPKAVAQAELDAWVSVKEQMPNQMEMTTNSLAVRDALRFSTSESATRGPAALFARAEAMRDDENTDWPTVFALLTDASRALALSVR